MAALLAATGNVAAQPSPVSLQVRVNRINSAEGVIRLALCPPESGFPNCNSSRARNATLSIANGTAEVTISDLAPGSYAVSVFHDANANGRLDTFVGIPKEGYGFSRNPPFRPRAPRFSEAVIQVTENASTVINLRYLF